MVDRIWKVCRGVCVLYYGNASLSGILYTHVFFTPLLPPPVPTLAAPHTVRASSKPAHGVYTIVGTRGHDDAWVDACVAIVLHQSIVYVWSVVCGVVVGVLCPRVFGWWSPHGVDSYARVIGSLGDRARCRW